jgi:menaquinone-dependent protoporphyrinogen oxidase
MRVLVAYATRHGSTLGIAERIAARLRTRGLEVDTCDAGTTQDIHGYDAFVVGSAAYMFHWLSQASTFVRRNRALLAKRPVWLFSSGPIGTETVDAKGRDILVASEPKEFIEFRSLVLPRGERVFFGAYDPDAPAVGMVERLGSAVLRHLPADARKAMPAGDFRDWAVIDAWADEIAEALAGPSEIPAREEVAAAR